MELMKQPSHTRLATAVWAQAHCIGATERRVTRPDAAAQDMGLMDGGLSLQGPARTGRDSDQGALRALNFEFINGSSELREDVYGRR
jgi:hypothetical protein